MARTFVNADSISWTSTDNCAVRMTIRSKIWALVSATALLSGDCACVELTASRATEAAAPAAPATGATGGAPVEGGCCAAGRALGAELACVWLLAGAERPIEPQATPPTITSRAAAAVRRTRVDFA